MRQLRAVYGGGVVAWTLCLLLTTVQGGGSARQTVVLLGLLAAFLVALLWSTWCLWETGTRVPGAPAGDAAHARADQP